MLSFKIGSARFTIQLEFIPGDLWVGVFIKRSTHFGSVMHCYVCFIPCVPIHIAWWR